MASIEDYPLLEKQILGHCGFSACQAVAEFQRWMFWSDVNPHSQMDALLRTTKCWLQPKQHSATQVTEQVTMESFLCMDSIAIHRVNGHEDESAQNTCHTGWGPGVCPYHTGHQQKGNYKASSGSHQAPAHPFLGQHQALKMSFLTVSPSITPRRGYARTCITHVRLETMVHRLHHPLTHKPSSSKRPCAARRTASASSLQLQQHHHAGSTLHNHSPYCHSSTDLPLSNLLTRTDYIDVIIRSNTSSRN